MANNEELKEVVETSEPTESNTEDTSEATKESPQETAGEQEETEVDDNDIEFDDSDTADEDEVEHNVEKKEKPLSKREINREKAKQRREKREKELHDSYLKGIKTATGDINPYTNTKMETNEDVQDYLDMKEMDSQGLDPTDSKDYIKFIREKQKKLDAENQARESATSKYQKELLEFKTKYNDVDIENLVNTDTAWASLIIPQIQSGKTLTQAYESVNSIINKSVNEKVETLASEKAKKQVQNSLASVGSQTIGEAASKPLDIWSMSDDEFREYQKRRGL